MTALDAEMVEQSEVIGRVLVPRIAVRERTARGTGVALVERDDAKRVVENLGGG